MTVVAHDQVEGGRRYVVHYPPHPPRETDPHKPAFDRYHRATRAKARCWIGQRVGFDWCRDAQGQPCPPAAGFQPGLELHHARLEEATKYGAARAALLVDYPDAGDPAAWAETAANLRWICAYHHRGPGGAHTVTHSTWEASQYDPGLTSPLPQGATLTAPTPTPTPTPPTPPSWLPEVITLATLVGSLLFGALGLAHPDTWVRVMLIALSLVAVPTWMLVRHQLGAAAWLTDLVQALQQALADLHLAADRLRAASERTYLSADHPADHATDTWGYAAPTDLLPAVRPAGLRGARPPLPPALRIPVKYAHEYALPGSPLLAPPTYPIDVTGGHAPPGGWEMLGNGPDPTLTVNGGNPVGDCVWAGRQHLRMVKALAYALTEGWETADQLVSEYLAYTGGVDQGAVIGEALHAWYQAGLIAGFAPVNLADRQQADAAMAAFRGLLCGVQLTADADQLFAEGRPWSVGQGQRPRPDEGHCIVQVQAGWPAGGLDGYLTWGSLQPATREWTDACRTEAWVLITPEDAQAAQVDLDAMCRDIDAWRGTRRS